MTAVKSERLNWEENKILRLQNNVTIKIVQSDVRMKVKNIEA